MDVLKDASKNIFVFSDSGKLIASSCEGEVAILTSGLLQAIAGIAIDSGDEIQCMEMGDKKVVFLLKQNIYFVIISSTGEPEAVLYRQLIFAHGLMLLMLTSKIHHVLEHNPSKDIRSLLGDDTVNLITTSFTKELATPDLAFCAMRSYIVDVAFREKILKSLKDMVIQSNAIACLILAEDRLLGYYIDETLGVELGTRDLILLSHFVLKSPALKYHDQNWVPLCLPNYNSSAFLQAFVSHFASEKSKLASDRRRRSRYSQEQDLHFEYSKNNEEDKIRIDGSSSMNSGSSGGIGHSEFDNNWDEHLRDNSIAESGEGIPSRTDDYVFVLITTDHDKAEYVHKFHKEVQATVQNTIEGGNMKLRRSSIRPLLNSLPRNQRPVHVLFKYSPEGALPAQYLASKFDFKYFFSNVKSSQSSHADEDIMEEGLKGLSVAEDNNKDEATLQKELEKQIWLEYQRQTLRLRRGSAEVDVTFFGTPVVTRQSQPAVALARSPCAVSPAPSPKSSKVSSRTNNSKNRQNNYSSPFVDSPDSNGSDNHENGEDSMSPDEILASSPSSDHALTCTTLSNGLVIVAVATNNDCELFVCFPRMRSVDACAVASELCKNLSAARKTCFQMNI